MEEWMDGMRKKGDLAEICLDKINLGGGGGMGLAQNTRVK